MLNFVLIVICCSATFTAGGLVDICVVFHFQIVRPNINKIKFLTIFIRFLNGLVPPSPPKKHKQQQQLNAHRKLKPPKT